MSNLVSPLTQLHEILTACGYPCQHMPPKQEQPFEQLLVALDAEDTPNEEFQYVMQVFFLEDVLKVTNPEAYGSESIQGPACLQMVLELPVYYEHLGHERRAEALGLLMNLSKAMPIGAWGIQGEKHQVYLRYALVGTDQNLDGRAVKESLDMLSFFVRTMAPALQAFIDQNLSWEQALEATGLPQELATIA
jgi:hypothetical protein